MAPIEPCRLPMKHIALWLLFYILVHGSLADCMENSGKDPIISDEQLAMLESVKSPRYSLEPADLIDSIARMRLEGSGADGQDGDRDDNVSDSNSDSDSDGGEEDIVGLGSMVFVDDRSPDTLFSPPWTSLSSLTPPAVVPRKQTTRPRTRRAPFPAIHARPMHQGTGKGIVVRSGDERSHDSWRVLSSGEETAVESETRQSSLEMDTDLAARSPPQLHLLSLSLPLSPPPVPPLPQSRARLQSRRPAAPFPSTNLPLHHFLTPPPPPPPPPPISDQLQPFSLPPPMPTLFPLPPPLIHTDPPPRRSPPSRFLAPPSPLSHSPPYPRPRPQPQPQPPSRSPPSRQSPPFRPAPLTLLPPMSPLPSPVFPSNMPWSPRPVNRLPSVFQHWPLRPSSLVTTELSALRPRPTHENGARKSVP